MQQGNRLIGRVVGVLRAFSEGGAVLSLKEIAARCELPPSSAHRMLGELMALGMVARAPHRRYRIGPDLYLLGAQLGDKARFVETALPFMRAVVERSEQTCLLYLHMPAHRSRIMVARLDPAQPLAIRTGLLQHNSLVWGAPGRAILAHLARAEVAAALACAPPSPVGGRPPPEPRLLLRSLAEIRARGYAVSSNEMERDAVALAVPLFAAERQVLGDLAVAERRRRWNALRERRAADLLCAQAAGLARALAVQSATRR